MTAQNTAQAKNNRQWQYKIPADKGQITMTVQIDSKHVESSLI